MDINEGIEVKDQQTITLCCVDGSLQVTEGFAEKCLPTVFSSLKFQNGENRIYNVNRSKYAVCNFLDSIDDMTIAEEFGIIGKKFKLDNIKIVENKYNEKTYVIINNKDLEPIILEVCRGVHYRVCISAHSAVTYKYPLIKLLLRYLTVYYPNADFGASRYEIGTFTKKPTDINLTSLITDLIEACLSKNYD
jgi:hypothetical protein